MVGQGSRDPSCPIFGRGSETLRKELEAENEGIRIPSTSRWLCGAPRAKAHHEERTFSASSVVLAFANENTFRRACKKGWRLQGRRYEVEADEEVRPDVGCGVGPHRAEVPSDHREMRLVCGGAQDEGTPVPRGGVPGQEGPLVPTHRGEVR